MQAGGVLKMAVAQRSGFSQHGNDFLLRGNEVHRCPRLFDPANPLAQTK
jgi:hypothetical protein